MASKRKVEIDVVTKDEQARAGLQRLSGEAAKTGTAFSKAGTILAGAFAAKQVLGGIVSATLRAQEMESQYAITAQVIESTGGAAKVTGDQIKDLATKQAELTGIDKDTILQGENVVLTFKNIRNEAGEGNDIFTQTTGIMLDMATVMGTDAKSAALQLGKALNDPLTGISALTRVGVTFTEQQKDQIKNYVGAGRHARRPEDHPRKNSKPNSAGRPKRPRMRPHRSKSAGRKSKNSSARSSWEG